MEEVKGGVKFDQGKLRVDLLSVPAMEGTAAVLTHGANKYGERNWEKGLAYSRCYAAVLRHLFAWWKGEDLDRESGMHHLHHAACELMFLQHFASIGGGEDNRPKGSD